MSDHDDTQRRKREIERAGATRIAELQPTDSAPPPPPPDWLTVADIGKLRPYRAGLQPITTGYTPLDRILGGGFRPDCMYVIAGRTGTAKSTLALNIAKRAALSDVVTLVFKLEETVIEAVYRLHACTAQVPLNELLSGHAGMTEETFYKLDDAWDLLETLPLRFADNRHIGAIQRITGKHVQDRGGLVIVDQLSMVNCDAEIGYQRATLVSNAFRLLARDLHIPIVVVSQVNRPASRSTDPLSIHDIRDSGVIENDSAGVILIDKTRKPDRPEYQGAEPIRYLEIHVGKNRYGPCTDPDKPVELIWWPRLCRVEELAQEPER